VPKIKTAYYIIYSRLFLFGTIFFALMIILCPPRLCSSGKSTLLYHIILEDIILSWSAKNIVPNKKGT
jgi:hypothetical protein